MQDEDKINRKYVFVCGMPRSGTSVFGRNIARLEECSGLKNTGVLEDEGIYLQDVYPLEFDLGGPTRFGFDPRSHRTETSELLAPSTVARLHACWNPYWDLSKSILIEKTPSNLLMTRFLQAAFPNAYFIVVKRHPVPVCMAAQKWKVSVTSLDTAFRHWLHCYRIFEEDRKHLNRVYEMKYEDYVTNPDRYHREIAAFIGTRVPSAQEGPEEYRYVTQWRSAVGTRVPEFAMEPVSGIHNTKYLERWADLLQSSPYKLYYRYLARKYEPQFAEHGYSLTDGLPERDNILRPTPLGTFLGAACSGAAAVHALGWRTVTQTRWRIKRTAKALLSDSIRARIKRPEPAGESPESAIPSVPATRAK